MLPELGIEEGTDDYINFRNLAEKIHIGRQMVVHSIPSQSQVLSWLSDSYELVSLSKGLANSDVLGTLREDHESSLNAIGSAKEHLCAFGNTEQEIEVEGHEVQVLLLLRLALNEVEQVLIPHVKSLINMEPRDWPPVPAKNPLAESADLQGYLIAVKSKQLKSGAPSSPRIDKLPPQKPPGGKPVAALNCLKEARDAYNHSGHSRGPRDTETWLGGIASLLKAFGGVKCTAAFERLTVLVRLAGKVADAPDGDYKITVVASPPENHSMRIPLRPTDHPLVGRQDVIATLAADLKGALLSASAGGRRWIMMHGDPGTGKTTTAIEIAKKLERDLPVGSLHVWVDGSSHAAMQSSIERMGHDVIPWIIKGNTGPQDIRDKVDGVLQPPPLNLRASPRCLSMTACFINSHCRLLMSLCAVVCPSLRSVLLGEGLLVVPQRLVHGGRQCARP